MQQSISYENQNGINDILLQQRYMLLAPGMERVSLALKWRALGGKTDLSKRNEVQGGSVLYSIDVWLPYLTLEEIVTEGGRPHRLQCKEVNINRHGGVLVNLHKFDLQGSKEMSKIAGQKILGTKNTFVKTLDTAFFEEALTVGRQVTVTSTSTGMQRAKEEFNALVEALKTMTEHPVSPDGLESHEIVVFASVQQYALLQEAINFYMLRHRATGEQAKFGNINGVIVEECKYLKGANMVAMGIGSIAIPSIIEEPHIYEKIGGYVSFEQLLYFGVGAVIPQAIFYTGTPTLIEPTAKNEEIPTNTNKNTIK